MEVLHKVSLHFPLHKLPLDFMAEPHVYERLLAVAYEIIIREDVPLIGGGIQQVLDTVSLHFPLHKLPLNLMAEPQLYERLLAVASEVIIREDVPPVGGGIRAYFR